MRLLTVAFVMVFLAPAALAKGPNPLQLEAGFLSPGERARFVYEADQHHVRVETNQVPVDITISRPGETTPLEVAANQTRYERNLSAGQARYVLDLHNDGAVNLRYTLLLEGPGFALVESTGIRQIAPEAWNTPAPGVGLAMACLLAGLLFWRRRR